MSSVSGSLLIPGRRGGTLPCRFVAAPAPEQPVARPAHLEAPPPMLVVAAQAAAGEQRALCKSTHRLMLKKKPSWFVGLGAAGEGSSAGGEVMIVPRVIRPVPSISMHPAQV